MHDILEELERTLIEERAAIRRLDVGAIEHAAARKSDLDGQLGARIARGERVSVDDRALLERVRACARANQLLLVHARACVRGVVAIVSGRLPDMYPTTNAGPAPLPPSAAAVRVNVTG